MRALVIDAYGPPDSALQVREVARPTLERGQVLVKVAAAPIHPADIAFVNGWYGVKRPAPTVPGLEGSGIVTEANAGAYGKWLIGKRVACVATSEGTGTWAEFVACDASSCIPLPGRIGTEAGSMLVVNPLTACSFLAIASKGRHRSLIQTAAGSALGRMVSRLARARGVETIDVVRRHEQGEALRAAGQVNVLCSSDADFPSQLREIAHRLDARIAFDAISGTMPATLATAMPHGGRVVIYCGLSGEPGRIEIPDVIFHAKGIDGYWLPLYIRHAGLLGMLPLVASVRRYASTIFESTVLDRMPLERFREALSLQRERASDGKVLLIP